MKMNFAITHAPVRSAKNSVKTLSNFERNGKSLCRGTAAGLLIRGAILAAKMDIP